MSDEYEQVARGKLKLKTDSNKVSKKHKKHKKNKEKEHEKLEREHEKLKNAQQAPGRQMTKAELSFKKMQEKMVSKMKQNINHFFANFTGWSVNNLNIFAFP